MKYFWLNDGNADDDGMYIAQVHEDDGPNGEPGKLVSTYKGDSYKSVADQLLQSNANATKEISRLRAARQPDRSPVQATPIKPAPLSNDDAFRLSAELNQPDRAPAAVQEIVTRTTGATPEQIGRTVQQSEQARLEAFWRGETDAFLAATPEYYVHPDNMAKILGLIEAKQYDLTRNNLAIVYDDLQRQGLLIQRPAQQEAQPGRQGANPPAEPNSPSQTTRPRMAVSTGLRSSDASGQRPNPSSAAPKYTARQIEAMPKAEYDDKLRDPAFRRNVDEVMTQRQRA